MSRTQAERSFLFLLILVGAALRLVRLGDGGFWLDETITAWRAVDLHATLATKDTTPAAFPLLVLLSKSLFGESEWSYRLPSALSGIVLPPLMFVLLRKRLGFTVAALASALMVLSPLGVYFAQEARAYSFYSLMAFLFTVCCWSITYPPEEAQKVTRRQWVVAFLCGLVLIHSHNYALFLTFAVGLVSLAHVATHPRQSYRSLGGRALLAMLVLLAALWAALNAHFVLGEAAQWGRQAAANNPHWPHPSASSVAVACLTTPFFNDYSFLEGYPRLQVLMGGLVVLWVAAILPRQHPGRYWGQICLLLTILTVWNNWRLPHFVARRYEFGYVPLFLVVTAIAVRQIPYGRLRIALIGLMILPVATVSFQRAWFRFPVQSASKSMAQVLARERVETVYVTLQKGFDPLYPSGLVYYLNWRMGLPTAVVELPRLRQVPKGFLSPTHYYMAYPELKAITPEQEREALGASLAGQETVGFVGRPDELEPRLSVAAAQGFETTWSRDFPAVKDRGMGRLVVMKRRPLSGADKDGVP